MSKRLKNCINGKIPKIDAVRDLLSGIDPEEVRKIHEETIDTLKRTACDPGTGNAEAEGNFCAHWGQKRVTAASRMSEEHIFYKNA